MSEAKGKITVIAHVGCNNTADSVELAAHAESVGVDAIASIPPIYFHLPEHLMQQAHGQAGACQLGDVIDDEIRVGGGSGHVIPILGNGILRQLRGLQRAG